MRTEAITTVLKNPRIKSVAMPLNKTANYLQHHGYIKAKLRESRLS